MHISLISLLLAVLAGCAAFFQMLWFRRIRDTVEGRGRRILYYHLVSLAFFAVMAITGFPSFVLGLLPMLLIVHYLPKKGYGALSWWSLALAAGVFFLTRPQEIGYSYIQEYADSRLILERLEHDKWVSEKKSQRHYFDSGMVDKTLEFDFVSHVNLGGIEVVLPVPKGFKYEITDVEKNERVTLDSFDVLFSSDTGSFEIQLIPIKMDDKELALILYTESILKDINSSKYDDEKFGSLIADRNRDIKMSERSKIIKVTPKLTVVHSSFLFNYSKSNRIVKQYSISGAFIIDKDFYFFLGYCFDESFNVNSSTLVTRVDVFCDKNNYWQ